LITKLLKKYSPVSISHYDIGSSSFFWLIILAASCK
jgi:hypothetical protein